MTSPELAQFMMPAGQADVGFHTGEVLAWDTTAGTNTIRVLGTPMQNLQVVATGSVMVGAGDLVAIWRYKSTYFIMGRIAPVSQALTVRAASDATTGTVTSTSVFTDLTGTTAGPTVSNVYIGLSRRCLVFLSCGCGSTDMGHGSAHFQVSGASTINPPTGAGNWTQGAFIGSERAGAGTDPTTVSASATRIFLLTAASGLNSGLNTFTVKYMGHPDTGTLLNNDVQFFDRVIVVLPL